MDYHRFQQRGESQESIFEIMSGISDMKLNQFEDYKREEWKNTQLKLFNINIKVLKLDQLQISGFNFLNQVKNIIVTFMSAMYVVYDNISLGELLSISYIIGQMNSPVGQLVEFFRSLQDAKLSLERLNEVQNHPIEEKEGQLELIKDSSSLSGVTIKNVSFQYEGSKSPFVLKNISLFIPHGKTTAIVGASGSGKTTLIKLLLKFYEPTQGDIYYNDVNVNSLSAKSLRSKCGVVMQDGYMFSDTIQRNIVMNDIVLDNKKLGYAAKVANVQDFINSLPLRYNTKIGAAGHNLSVGQKQRILIARAVYKNPDYILFDEATNSLDAINEKVITENLQKFNENKTVVVVAHRLSTVKNADSIVVLDNGEIVEQGTHEELIKIKGYYFNLVKNQLELGM